ncbi:hypothetical protein LEL86_08055 [Streptomyces sp. WA6-1-16]|nr:hypothetical protein [Streptomyces sp. WA6-1-16]OSC69797.1 hypothetical protein B5180_26235 [Streptomyces sp. BF-3]UCA49232.1 hypothetical protein LEL86_08055 [Streptomyces sp. WA6-1-16]SCF73387.1 hypothetical protein GA0115280_1096100 [Streptomyces sp. Cmuel-A718b]
MPSRYGRVDVALVVVVSALFVSLAVALGHRTPSTWILVAVLLLLTAVLTVAKAAPDGRISQVFRIRSKRDERLMLAIIPIDAVLTGVLLVRGERGLALVMAGATAVAAVRLWVARKTRGARDVRPVP